jgi:hypothetical protein
MVWAFYVYVLVGRVDRTVSLECHYGDPEQPRTGDLCSSLLPRRMCMSISFVFAIMLLLFINFGIVFLLLLITIIIVYDVNAFVG